MQNSASSLVSSFDILYPVGMCPDNCMKIISVTGAHSNVGKTTLGAILVSNLKGFGAIKFTKTPLYSSVTDDPEILYQEGKDTAVLSESGAVKVLWIKSPPSGLKDALKTALNEMTGVKGIVVEGNSPVEFLNPHLVIFIVAQDGHVKPSALKASKKADIIIVNSLKPIKNPPFLTQIASENSKVFWIDLINKKGEIDKFVEYIKQHFNFNC
jgi:molybdopterin-guanine dinucleotide biosynthesis protein